MDFVAIEAPAAGVALTGELPELVDRALGVVGTGKGLQMFADDLIQTLAEDVGSFAGTRDDLLVDREGDVHGLPEFMVAQAMCAQVMCDREQSDPTVATAGGNRRVIYVTCAGEAELHTIEPS